MPLRTPLHARHVALGARMVEFAGYEMPLQYTSIREEHVAVRERAGLFDVSHMGEVVVGGEGSLQAVQRLVASDAARLEPDSSLYSVMCNRDGGVVDDVIVTRGEDPSHFVVTVNAACREKDVRWISEHAGTARVADLSDHVALLAVQGPAALDVVGELTGADLRSLRPFHTMGARLADLESRVSKVSRTGYTGEDGCEIYIDAGVAPALWDALLEAGRAHGVVPCGLGARDTLRLEAALRLYGQDMDEDVDPYSAGLGWTVKLDKGVDFVGREALAALREAGPPAVTIGLELAERAIPRHGQAVLVDGRRVGAVTSGGHSFTLGVGIALARVERDEAGHPEYAVDIRGTLAPARAVRLPFYRRPAAPPDERPRRHHTGSD